MNNKVDYRFSDTDFATYLMIKGYVPTHIEVTNDKKSDKLKAFTHFQGDKEEFIKLQEDYNSESILVNPKEFSMIRKKLNSMIKIELNNYRLNNG